MSWEVLSCLTPVRVRRQHENNDSGRHMSVQFLSISLVIDVIPTSRERAISSLMLSTSCQEGSNFWRVVQRQVGTWNL